MTLHERADGRCELCGTDSGLAAFPLPPHTDDGPEHALLACATCRAQLDGAPLDAAHWRCLEESAWSPEPPVQVAAFRILGKLGEAWANDLRDQLYLEDDVRVWAEDVSEDDDEPTLDSNGTRLQDGDSVTLIKDLDVKGTSFVAKRGTMVRNIRLTGDPKNVEGRVNKVALVLKTEFLKKA